MTIYQYQTFSSKCNLEITENCGCAQKSLRIQKKTFKTLTLGFKLVLNYSLSELIVVRCSLKLVASPKMVEMGISFS